MANLSSNPWSITSADVNTATVSTITLNADGTVTLVTTAAATFAAGNGLAIFNVTNVLYHGFYVVITVTSTTTYQLAPQFSIPAGTAASGTGTAAVVLYNAYVRIEDLSWQNASAAGQLLDLRDRSGNILWQATATGVGSQNRGKLFWVNGIAPVLIQSGIVLATVN